MISPSHLIPADLHETCKLRLLRTSVNAKYLFSVEGRGEGGKYQQFVAISGLHSSLTKEIQIMTKTFFYMNHSIYLRRQLRPF